MQKPLRQAKTIDNVFNSAYWHLGQQDYTIAEIRQKLSRKTDNQQWIEEVISKLLADGYLKDDARFSILFCERAFFNELGSQAIKQKLSRRGVPASVIEQAIETVSAQMNIDEYAMAASRLRNSYPNFSNTNKEKLFQQMGNKGFSRDQIAHALSLHPDADNLITKLQQKAQKANLEQEIIKRYKKGKGRTLILQELKQQLIDVSDFADTLYRLELSQQVDFYQSCAEQLQKKRFDLTDYNDKSKAYAFLMRKGFSSDEIKAAFDTHK